MNPEMKDCPFCGHKVDMDDPDTLYPNGIGWRAHEDGFITYHHFLDVPKEQWCYSMHCVETSGGCGAKITANSKDECIQKWNRRPTQEK